MGFRQRLALFLVATLVGVQALTAILAYSVIRSNLVDQETRELEGATAAFTRRLDLLSQNVADDVTVLSLDYALRSAVAEHDIATTLSVLDNHGRRVGATRMLLVDLEGNISADTTRYNALGTQFPFPGLLRDAAVQYQGTALAVLDGAIYWVVVVPVKAPVPIAFIAAGIPVDAPLLDRLRSLSATPHSLALASVDERGAWTLVGQSVGSMPRLPQTDEIPAGNGIVTEENGDSLVVTTRLVTAENSAPIIAILDYPMSELLGVYWAVLVPVLAVFAVALAVGLFGAALIARSVSRPLEALAGSARRIASGDYSVLPEIRRKDEIGDLSRALENMSESIAERETSLLSAVSSLEIARDEAVGANEAKAQFLSNMSHELRTSLNAILGFSGMIQGEVLGPVGTQQYADYAGSIHESGEHLLVQLTAMLSLVDASAGKTTLARERIAPGTMLLSIAETLLPVAAKADISLSVGEDISALPEIEGDTSKLRQSLMNLVHNAIKFSPSGGTVEILGEVNSQTLLLRISDQGKGIAADELRTITQPFSRQRKAFDGTHQGAGIGLPFAKTIIELHGGELEIDSALGEGTTVTVKLLLPSGAQIHRLGSAA